MPRPSNLPNNWDYQEATNCVVCGGCLFRYGAEHPNGDGRWTCPNCGDGNGADSNKKPTIEELEAILNSEDDAPIEIASDGRVRRRGEREVVSAPTTEELDKAQFGRVLHNRPDAEEKARVATTKLGLRPIEEPLGDGHHTDVPFIEEDEEVAELAYWLGCLFSDVQCNPEERLRDSFWYNEMTSFDTWKRVARALRIHGLKITNR